jgi:hypothetical protein
MDAGFDYCRKIVDDVEFNKKQFRDELSLRLPAVGGQYSIPTMEESLQAYFQNVTSLVVPGVGHFVSEEQLEVLARYLISFLSATAWPGIPERLLRTRQLWKDRHGKEKIVSALSSGALPETLRSVLTRLLFVLRAVASSVCRRSNSHWVPTYRRRSGGIRGRAPL